MDFSGIFQIKTKKFWWMDVIFYFVISLLVATIFCYVVFLAKNYFQRAEIEEKVEALKTVGTKQQKEQEEYVLLYQRKIKDFTTLLSGHEFASSVFAFMQKETMPNIWFKQFNLDGKSDSMQLTGESDDMDSLSRQVANLERNEYVKNLTALSSSLGDSAKIEFNLKMVLEKKIFDYILHSSLEKEKEENNLENTEIEPEVPAEEPAELPSEEPAEEPENTVVPEEKSSEKNIISFSLASNPEISAEVDQMNKTVVLNLPHDANIKNLTPVIAVSPKATVVPSSNVSQDFTSPVSYRVIAEDATIQDYTVQVVLAPKPVKKSIWTNILIFLISAIAIGGASVSAFFIYKKIKRVN